MSNPEIALLRKRANREDSLSPSEEAVYDWYLKNPRFREIRVSRNRLQEMDDFLGIYDFKEIQRDKEKVQKLRDLETEKDKTQRGEIFETIVGEYGDMAEWFGDMTIAEVLEYDDRINHVDLVLSGKNKQGESVFLALDCTVSENNKNIEKKISRIANEIKRGRLTQIKYYKHPDTDQALPLSNIPRIILVIDKERLKRLCEDIIKVIQRKKGSNRELAQNQIQFELLNQMKSQLENQRELAKNSSAEIRQKIDLALGKVLELIEQKKFVAS